MVRALAGVESRCAIVDIGTTRTSSSFDSEAEPADSSTPITTKDWPLTTISFPTGASWPNSVRAVSGPSTATWAADDCSASVKNRPSARVRARTSTQAGRVPFTWVEVSAVPYWTVAAEVMIGATPATSGAIAGSAITSASERVNPPEPEPDNPLDSPPLPPGITIRRLEPSLLISLPICSRAPSPRPTVSMTAAMPMRMPSMVSSERMRRPLRASQAVRKVSVHVIAPPPRPR